jgi:hypothetical protein
MAFTPASSLSPASVTVAGTVSATQGTSPWLTDGSAHAQPVTIAATVLVDGSAHIQPVSGTVAVTQATSPWVVDGSAVTQPVSIAATVPVSVASLPLPAGAATEATLGKVRDAANDIALTAIVELDTLEAA